MVRKPFQKMFGVSKCPVVDFGLKDISQQAIKMTGKVSISGVQPKLFVNFDEKEHALITADDGEYILKPQTSSFFDVPQNEQCCMDIAEEIGIDVPVHCLLPLKDKSLAYIVKRFDRNKGEKIHQEDFCQILAAKDKYVGSVEQVGRKLKEVSSIPGLDVQLFFERVVFNFLIGNGDAHLKNYSVYYPEGQIRLTPAYDVVCSRLVIQDHDSALMINGRDDKLGRKDFDSLAGYFNIPIKVRYDKFIGKLKLMEETVRSSMLDEEKRGRFIKIIRERYQRLEIVG
jgi:serine/threonine-protein kinase HipA